MCIGLFTLSLAELNSQQMCDVFSVRQNLLLLRAACVKGLTAFVAGIFEGCIFYYSRSHLLRHHNNFTMIHALLSLLIKTNFN